MDMGPSGSSQRKTFGTDGKCHRILVRHDLKGAAVKGRTWPNLPDAENQGGPLLDASLECQQVVWLPLALRTQSILIFKYENENYCLLRTKLTNGVEIEYKQFPFRFSDCRTNRGLQISKLELWNSQLWDEGKIRGKKRILNVQLKFGWKGQSQTLLAKFLIIRALCTCTQKYFIAWLIIITFRVMLFTWRLLSYSRSWSVWDSEEGPARLHPHAFICRPCTRKFGKRRIKSRIAFSLLHESAGWK